MLISLLQTERSFSLLTHIRFSASLDPELLFTRNTIANPPSAITSCQVLEIQMRIRKKENTSTTTGCFPTVNFLPMKLLCGFSFSFSSRLLSLFPNIFFISEKKKNPLNPHPASQDPWLPNTYQSANQNKRPKKWKWLICQACVETQENCSKHSTFHVWSWPDETHWMMLKLICYIY